jgi:sugar phosphate isomerase/epimerase
VKIAAYSVHGGNFATLSKRSLAYATFLENVHRLDRLCQMRGIVLGVETMYPTSPNHATQNLLDNAEEVTQFCQDAPEIKLVIDLAHLNIWQNHSLKAKLQWLQLTPERLLEIHISDNDGLHDTHSRITPQTWWIPHIAQFPVGVPIVLESRLNRLSVAGVKQECEQIQQLLQMN